MSQDRSFVTNHAAQEWDTAPSSRNPSASAAATRWWGPIAAAITVLLTTVLAACGSSHSTSSASASTTVKQTCRQLGAVLSNGPEPEVDPLGYAQAQILPLRQIRTSDERLHRAIDNLASAYQSFSSSDGASSAKSAVRTASKAVEAICPGVAS
jgi:hypothetical protein